MYMHIMSVMRSFANVRSQALDGKKAKIVILLKEMVVG
jgi:hypothetical protein